MTYNNPFLSTDIESEGWHHDFTHAIDLLSKTEVIGKRNVKKVDRI